MFIAQLEIFRNIFNDIRVRNCADQGREERPEVRIAIVVFIIERTSNIFQYNDDMYHSLYPQCRFIKDVACNDCISEVMGLSAALNVIVKLKLMLIILTKELHNCSLISYPLQSVGSKEFQSMMLFVCL